MTDPVLLQLDARGVAHVTLHRPDIGNAYDGAMLAALIEGLTRLEGDADVRAVVIRGAGRHFQAGADVAWLARVAEYAPEQAFEASMATTRAMQLLNEFPRPTIAVVHGACFGGGCGLVCCTDVALATPDAVFGLTEVRLGVAPTPISPHLVQAIGLRHMRRYGLTGERFGAAEACRIGLVHEVVAEAGIEARLAEVLDAVLLSAPGAVATTKRTFLAANGLTLDADTMAVLARESAEQRASAEGREGTRAFLEKRRPNWYASTPG